MTALNIFQCIRNTTRRIEPFHSQFLGDAMRASLAGDRELFDGIWGLCAPNDWAPPPQDADVSNESKLDGAQRIDILIEDKKKNRVLGIEVKTSRASARAGQLEGYLEGLKKGYAEEKIAIAYLTPFNRLHAANIIGEENAGALSTVKVFDEFHGDFKQSRHVSWLDVAAIKWDGGCVLWHQHQSYVTEKMADPDRLRGALSRNRSLDEFFSEEAVEAFWDELPPQSGDGRADNGATMELAQFEGREREVARKLARALTYLITDDDFVVRGSRKDRFNESLREPFMEPPYSEFHKAVFELSENFENVWLQGKRNYGLRVAHKDHSGGVSLVTSQDVGRLIVGKRR